MNQISTVTTADPMGQFITMAGKRLRELGYDVGHVSLSCISWRGEHAMWRFRPSTFIAKNLPDIEAKTAEECMTKARAWLDGMKPEAEMLADVLGITP